jgi:hypothetical protein
LIYAVPGLLAGLILAQSAFSVFKSLMAKIIRVPIPEILSTSSLLLASAMAFVVPLTSAAIPIHRVLTLDIRDVLDRPHAKSSPSAVTVERSAVRALHDFCIGCSCSNRFWIPNVLFSAIRARKEQFDAAL